MKLKKDCQKILKENTLITNTDILLCMIISFLCVLFFNHRDILITAERSVGYIQNWNLFDNIAHFYSNSIENLGDSGANYLPTTFIIFAIWNIPLKIFGLTPHYLRDWSVVFTIWNKLLPILIFIISGYLLFKICYEEFGFSLKKSKLAMYLFLTSPIAFFSQFLFCQYDIFTVFCLLLGTYFYYKEERSRRNTIFFILSFGIGFTFKYFIILIFFVLLFLREKNIIKIGISSVAAVIPAALETCFYLIFDRADFMSQVFNFGVLNFASESSSLGEAASVSRFNILYLLLFVFLAFAYLKKPATKRDSICSFLFLSCGICTVIFSLMSWNPQWLLFIVPFWTLALCTSKHYKVLLCLDYAFTYAFYAYVTKVFENNVDQTLLQYGILKNILRYRIPLDTSETMQKFFLLDTNTLFTVIVCVFVFYFLAAHSNYSFKNLSHELTNIRLFSLIRYFYAVLLFVIPAVICGIQLYQQPELIWSGYRTNYSEYVHEIDIKDFDITQEINVPRNQLNSIYLETRCSEEISSDMKLQAELLDKDENLIAVCQVNGQNINKNGYTIFNFNEIEIPKDETIRIRITADSEKTVFVKTTTYEKGYVFNNTKAVKGIHDKETLNCQASTVENTALNMMVYGD